VVMRVADLHLRLDNLLGELRKPGVVRSHCRAFFLVAVMAGRPGRGRIAPIQVVL
jgi:hypothetical protein